MFELLWQPPNAKPTATGDPRWQTCKHTTSVPPSLIDPCGILEGWRGWHVCLTAGQTRSYETNARFQIVSGPFDCTSRIHHFTECIKRKQRNNARPLSVRDWAAFQRICPACLVCKALETKHHLEWLGYGPLFLIMWPVGEGWCHAPAAGGCWRVFCGHWKH